MMKQWWNKIIFVVLILLSTCLNAQTRAVSSSTAHAKIAIKPKETQYLKLSAKLGCNISVIYLARNIKDKNNEPGYCGGLTYEVNDFVRVSALYTRFQPINIKPTWLDVKANTLESNLEIIARFPNKKTLLYPFFGLSYNTYKGYFTGESDYLNLREYYQVNSIVKNQWLGFNIGTGMEHNFGVVGLFIDYRMRVGKQEKAFNIMDVCYTGGVRIRMPYGQKAKSFFRLNDRFSWF